MSSFPGLVVVTAPRLEPLADALVAEIVRDPLPPLAPETILVAQNAGLGEWLARDLAERLGCAAGLDVGSPRALVGRLARAFAPAGRPDDAEGGTVAPFERPGLRWRLARRLAVLAAGPPPDGPDADVLAALGATLGRRGPEGPLELAERLAALFDDYQVYRPDLLAAWEARRPSVLPEVEAHPHAAWQAALWRALVAEGAGDSRAAQAERLLGELSRFTVRQPEMPHRVTLFGAGLIPPVYLRVLHALGRLIPVRAYTVWPTGVLPPDGGYAHPLLEALGGRAVEHAAVLAEVGARTVEGVPPPAPDAPSTALARLQADLAADRLPATLHTLDAADRSLTVHACHSERRELEVLRDHLLDAFAARPGLRPRDVLVVVPDLARYAPLAEAVFGEDPDGAGALPIHVAGHPHSPARRALDAVARLLTVPLGRAPASEMLDLLDAPALRRAAGLRADEVPVLREAVRAAGIRWGRDAAHRARAGLPARDAHTWQQGLDRLMLTVTMGAGARPAGPPDLAPAAVAADADLIGRLVHWATRVFDHARTWDGPPQPLGVWAAALGRALDDLTAPDDDDEHDALAAVRRAVAALDDARRVLPTAEDRAAPVPFAAVRRALQAEMDAFTPRARTLAGRITVASPVALRHAPFRVVAFLGLGAGSWPPVHTPDALDLMAVALRDGDEAPAAGGRRLVLDALLAARDRLHLSYVARSERDDSARAPSPALAAVLDTLDRTFTAPPPKRPGERAPVSGALVVPHRLQPFSSAYHDGQDARLFTFRRRTERHGGPVIAFADDDLPPPPAPPERLDADALARAWANPARALARGRLGLPAPPDSDDADPDDEPLGLSGLEAWAARLSLIASRREAPPDEARRHLAADGRLPDGHLGHIWTETLEADIARVERARASVPGHPLVVEVALATADQGAPATDGPHVVVAARLPHACPRCGVSVVSRPGRLRTDDWALAWASHLVWVLSAPDDAPPRETWLVGRDEAHRIAGAARAADYLAWLVGGWREIRTRRVPLLAEASRAYADKAHPAGWPADDAAARAWARKTLDDQYNRPGERSTDLHVAQLWDGADPTAHADFGRWARCLWKPIREHATQMTDADLTAPVRSDA